MLDLYQNFDSVCRYLGVQINKIPCKSHTISEIVQHLELAQIKKKYTAKNYKAHYVPVLNQSHAQSRSRCWLTLSERCSDPLCCSVSLAAGNVWLLSLEQPLCIQWGLAVPHSCFFEVEAGFLCQPWFFNAFVFQKWQHQVYSSRKQTGVGEVGHALRFHVQTWALPL